MNEHVVVIIPGCVYVYKHWLGRGASTVGGLLDAELFTYLKPHRGYGGFIDPERHTARFGDRNVTYDYGGRSYPLAPFSPVLNRLRCCVEWEIGQLFNVAYVNRYATGAASIPRHSDASQLPQLGQQPTIASVSFGQARLFQFWASSAPRDKHHMVQILLEEGDLCIMRGRSQLDWLHGVPKQKDATQPRTSITFRHHRS